MHPDNKRALENRVTGAAEAQGIAEHTAVRGSGRDRVLAREQVRLVSNTEPAMSDRATPPKTGLRTHLSKPRTTHSTGEHAYWQLSRSARHP